MCVSSQGGYGKFLEKLLGAADPQMKFDLQIIRIWGSDQGREKGTICVQDKETAGVKAHRF